MKQMKTVLPVLAIISIVGLFQESTILFQDNDYITSAALTASWVFGICFLIGFGGNKQKETK
jgi:hypothetical protein